MHKRLFVAVEPADRWRRPTHGRPGFNLRAMDLLSDSEISERLGELDGWERKGEAISTFDRGDFVGSVEFIRRLVEPAEGMGHHPDLSISWNQVEVTITTHSAGGLTANDFELAKKIDAVASG
jgi:4a-hydroxytetrahydrobiopterin dehydratase